MTYDFHGSWERNVGENSPLYKGPADQGSMIYFNVVSEGSCCKLIQFFIKKNKLIKIQMLTLACNHLCVGLCHELLEKQWCSS